MRRTVALPRQLVRACTAARGARRRFSTSYYDSQSGEHVQRVDGLLLHELSLSASTSLRPEQLSESSVGTRLSSFELPLSAISKDKLTGLPLAFARLTEQEHTADMVGRCAELGVGASLSLKVGNGLGADAAITKVIRVAEVAAESGAGGVLVRACLLDALGHDSPSRVELVCAKLADAGVSVLTLGGEEGREIDEDEMEELVEALIQADVVGTPMQDRIGLRAPNSGAEAERLCARAMELGVRRFDTHFSGGKGGPPQPARLAAVAQGIGIEVAA